MLAANPARCGSRWRRVSRIEAANEAVGGPGLWIHVLTMPNGRESDLRRERQRGDDAPGGERAIVGPVGNAARPVSEEATLNAVNPA